MKVPILIISAPSGAGKNSFVERLLKDFPNHLYDTTTFTTREMRRGESDGVPYHFVSRDRFVELIEQGFFVEWAKVHEHLYGTPHYQLEEAWRDGRTVIMDVDIQGAKTFKQKFPDSQSLFIMPPSLEELKRRIIKRDGAPPPDLDLRLKNAEHEMSFAKEFDHLILNDDFEEAYQKAYKLVAELVGSD